MMIKPHKMASGISWWFYAFQISKYSPPLHAMHYTQQLQGHFLENVAQFGFQQYMYIVEIGITTGSRAQTL